MINDRLKVDGLAFGSSLEVVAGQLVDSIAL